MRKWVGGLAEWTDKDTAYLSVAFTWKLDEAWSKAVWYKAQGYNVRAGGPALFLVKMRHRLADVAELSSDKDVGEQLAYALAARLKRTLVSPS